MNAGIRGTMLVKADRINYRIDQVAKIQLNEMEEHNKTSISRTQFKDFIKTIHVIIDTELCEKGVEKNGTTNCRS